jgi:hypothetical protein
VHKGTTVAIMITAQASANRLDRISMHMVVGNIRKINHRLKEAGIPQLARRIHNTGGRNLPVLTLLMGTFNMCIKSWLITI